MLLSAVIKAFCFTPNSRETLQLQTALNVIKCSKHTGQETMLSFSVLGLFGTINVCEMHHFTCSPCNKKQIEDHPVLEHKYWKY